MQTVKKATVPPQAAKLQGETIHKVPSENKNLSTPFRDREVSSQPGMSGLSEVQVNVPGCQNPLQAPYSNATLNTMRSKISEFRLRLMYSSPEMIRQDAIEVLTLLIRFDKQIGINDSRTLCEASMAINRATEGRST